MIELFDSHVHLEPDGLEDTLSRAAEVGVNRFLAIGASDGLKSNMQAKGIASKYDNIWFTAGIHPHDAKDYQNIDGLESFLKNNKLKAIGETGLDYYRDWAPKDSQQKLFEAHLALAKDMSLPVVIHSREAAGDCLATIKKFLPLKGVFHCFSDDLKTAEEIISIGFYVSIPGSLTFKKSESFRDTVSKIPLEKILLETDAPYITPEPFRGKKNESAFMFYTAKKLAEIKKESLEKIASITTSNTRELFSI